MGVSYSIIALSEIQQEQGFIEHIDSVEKYGALDYREPDNSSRYPTLNEVLETLKKAGIEIKSENKYLDDIELRKGNKLIVHSFSIVDKEQDYEDDLTIKYLDTDNANVPVLSISGIKSSIRILIKFTTHLTKICGAFIILSPYEVCLIKKSVSYEDFLEEIKGKLIDDN